MPAKTVAISGASGFLGKNLSNYLEGQGFKIKYLVRNESDDIDKIYYNYETKEIDKEKLKKCDIVIHLAGKNLLTFPFTKKVKNEVWHSRVNSTKFLADTIESLGKNGPKVFLCASAVGIYGDKNDDVLLEDSPKGKDFLAQLCEHWEKAAHINNPQIRVVSLRISPVLAKEGGMLKSILPIFNLCLGGTIGSGKQYLSFISLEDFCRAILFIINNQHISGPANICSPFAVTNKNFTKALAMALKRPAWFFLPAWVINLFLRQGATMLTSSIRAYPKVLLDNGFYFCEPSISKLFLTVL